MRWNNLSIVKSGDGGSAGGSTQTCKEAELAMFCRCHGERKAWGSSLLQKAGAGFLSTF